MSAKKSNITIHAPKPASAPKKGIKQVRNKDVVKHASRIIRLTADHSRALSLLATYVVIPDSKDSKGETSSKNSLKSEIEDLKLQISLMRTAARNSIGGHQVKTYLWVKTSITSGVNAAIGGVYGLIPSGSAEWAAYIALYDEVRVSAITHHYLGGCSINPTTVPNGGQVNYAVAYDPDFGTNATSVVDVLESDGAKLHAMPAGINPAMVIPTGMHSFTTHIRPRTVMNDDMKTDNNFPGSWMSCLDTNDSVGYFRYYVEAPGATGVTGLQIFQEYHCEFRIRT